MVTYKKLFLNILLVTVVTCLFSSELHAEPSPAGVAKAMHWWMTEGGPKLQATLGHKGFRAARPAVPIMIENRTNSDILFALESASCAHIKHIIKAGEIKEYTCNTTSGDNWYNIYFADQKYGLDGGAFEVFETINGRLELNNYSHLIQK